MGESLFSSFLSSSFSSSFWRGWVGRWVGDESTFLFLLCKGLVRSSFLLFVWERWVGGWVVLFYGAVYLPSSYLLLLLLFFLGEGGVVCVLWCLCGGWGFEWVGGWEGGG